MFRVFSTLLLLLCSSSSSPHSSKFCLHCYLTASQGKLACTSVGKFALSSTDSWFCFCADALERGTSSACGGIFIFYPLKANSCLAFFLRSHESLSLRHLTVAQKQKITLIVFGARSLAPLLAFFRVLPSFPSFVFSARTPGRGVGVQTRFTQAFWSTFLTAGLSYYLYNEAAFLALSCVHPITREYQLPRSFFSPV